MSTDTSSVIVMPTDSYARIRNPRLLVVVRVVLIIVFTIITAVGALSIPANFRDIRNSILAQPDTLHDLANLGISVDAGAIYTFALYLAQTLVFTVAGVVVFIYRSDDWVAILISTILVGN